MDGYVKVATVADFDTGKFTSKSLGVTVATISLPCYVQVDNNGTATVAESPPGDEGTGGPSQKTTKIAVFRHDGKYYAVNAVCPHAGYGLDKGAVMDIEDPMLGKVGNVVCPQHGWTFNFLTGQCYSSKYVLSIHGTKISPDPSNSDLPTVWCSILPVNDDIEGPRRDFGGKVLTYEAEGWAGDFT